MKQETINKNKLLTILCAVALTLGVLVSAVLFSMPPAHAADTSTYGTRIFRCTYDNGRSLYEYWSTNTNDLHFCLFDDNMNGRISIFYSVNVLPDFTLTARYGSIEMDGTEHASTNTILPKSFHSLELSDGTMVYWAFGGAGSYTTDNGWSIEGYCPIYPSTSDYPNISYSNYSKAFFEHLIVIGDIKPSNTPPDAVDESYSFTGFTMNGRTARWTGITERSYAKEVDVEEYVKVSYAWATTTDSDNLGELQSYDGEFPTSDKQLTLPWSDMEKGKTDFQFIRQVKIFPCYRVPHLAYYIGQPVTIYYNGDGTIEKVSGEQLPFMYPDSNTTIQGNNSIKLIDYNVTKDFKAVWSGLDGIGSQSFTHSFIEFEVGYALSSSPGNVSSKSVVKERCLVSSGSFQIPSSYLQADSNKYVLYVKATPYHYNGDDPTFRLYRGSPSYKYFDENGDPSWDYTDTSDVISGGGGHRRGTVNLTDFLLSGVSVKDSLLGYSTITWTGTTKDSDLLFVSESDTAVIVTYILTTKEGEKYKYTPVTYGTTTINAGKMNINVAKLVDEAQKSGEAWDMEIRLTPTYTSNGILYIGEQTVCHMTDKTVKNETINPDGSLKIDDVTDNVVPGDVDGKVEITADDLAGYTNTFVSFLKGLINAMGQIPQLIGTVFSFLPDMYRNAIGILFIVILILRILGR